MKPPRRVVYIVVDGMSTESFELAVASGSAPALSFLKEHGHYVRDATAIFPTITPAATASLVTGEVPARHGIPGMCWYDRDAERFVNYGQSPRAAVVEGMTQVVRDVLGNLNSAHLSPEVSTIHEQLDAMGIATASVNFMVFRGPYTHELKPNLLERMLFRQHLPETIPGPKEHYFADVVSGPADACSDLMSARGLEQRIQATDGWASCVTRQLLEEDAARMILFYLHENDHRSHRKGPTSQVDNLVGADRHIANVLDAFGSWDRTLHEVGFVVTADHGQTPIGDDDDHILDLGEILDDFKQVQPKRGKERFKRHDLAAAGNGRVGFIYLDPERRAELLKPVVRTLMEERGIDQVMWRDADDYVVATDRGWLRFTEGDAEGIVDDRHHKWSVKGELGAVGGVVDDDRLVTGEYPLALWRIKSALDLDRIGDVVVTPRLTYEFKDLAGGHHRGGGDHASLHAQDSQVPFLSTLAPPPIRPATVDVMPHIVRHFQRMHS